MDFSSPKQRDVFFDVHHKLPREGPGNKDCTARALSLAGQLPEAASILDIACGPGMQTIHLGELLPAARYKDDSEAMSVIDECSAEIDFYERYPDYYGYVFLVMSKL